jgi:membrane-bound lytic murein transglycosylase D
MEERFPMTHRPTDRLRWRVLVRLTFAALTLGGLLAGCATNGNPDAPAIAANEALSAKGPDAAASAAAASAAASAPDGAASAPEMAAAPAEAASAPVAVDPLRPEAAVDLNDAQAHADLWARVRRGFAMPDLDNELVHDREQWYATRPDYVQRMTERGSRYLFHIVEELERRHMPTELALLPFIESAFNPQAMSSAKASGMWQFMPGTGRDFSLKQNIFRDDRRDVLASTRAALDYLDRLHGMFGDWHLALAAYNWGEGNVTRAIARNQRLGLPTNYLNLRMPFETQQYVPKLQAVKNIVNRPEAFSLSLPQVANHPYFLSVPITRDIDVSLAARFAELPVEDFKNLNPQMNKPVILAAGTPYVLLPYDNADRFVHAMGEHQGALASWTAWVAPKTLRPAEAAKQVGMSEEQLREVNRIPPRMVVKAGSTLLVPRTAQRMADVSPQVADNATMSLAPDAPALRKVAFKAGKKETVATVARRYRVNAAQVAQWNQVSANAAFKPGQQVVVFVANKAPATRHASTKRPVKHAATKPAARTAKSGHGSSTKAARSD